MPLDIPAVRGILPRGGTILGSLAHQPRQDRGRHRAHRGEPHEAGHRRAHRDRRRGHPRCRDHADRARLPRRRRPQDDRQRPVRHRLHLRLRHRGQHRHRGDRPAAHDGRVAPPHPHLRGHGPARRLDRAALRHGRRRQRHPHPRGERSTSTRSSAGSSRASRRPTRRSSSSPRVPCPTDGDLITKDAVARLVRPRQALRHRRLAGPAGRGAHRPRGPHHGARPHPARRHADGVRPRAGHPVRPATPSTAVKDEAWGTMVALQGTDIVRVPLAGGDRRAQDGPAWSATRRPSPSSGEQALTCTHAEPPRMADLPAAQQPPWPDADELRAARDELSALPPLVFAGECDVLGDAAGRGGPWPGVRPHGRRLRRDVRGEQRRRRSAPG